jgi:hypothetical protein
MKRKRVRWCVASSFNAPPTLQDVMVLTLFAKSEHLWDLLHSEKYTCEKEEVRNSEETEKQRNECAKENHPKR